MQDEINKVVVFTNTWLMRLNKSKCKIMQLGKKTRSSNNYCMNSYDMQTQYCLKKQKKKMIWAFLFQTI